jgi:predicted transcriptional regulator
MSQGPFRAPLLGDLERAAMAHFWRRGPGDAKDVHSELGAPRGITLNTIQSTLKRLFEKGLLERDKVSHAHVYRARVSEADYHRTALSDVVDELMRGRTDAMVAAFVDLADAAGPEPLARLERLVAERRKEKKGGPA